MTMPLFEVWYPNPAVPDGWSYVGVGQDRRAAQLIATQWASYVHIPARRFRIRPVRGLR